MKLFVILSIFVVFSARICSAAPVDVKVEVRSSYNEISRNSYRFGYDLSCVLMNKIIIFIMKTSKVWFNWWANTSWRRKTCKSWRHTSSESNWIFFICWWRWYYLHCYIHCWWKRIPTNDSRKVCSRSQSYWSKSL